MNLLDKVIDRVKNSRKLTHGYVPPMGKSAYSYNYYIDNDLHLCQYHAVTRVTVNDVVLAILDDKDTKVLLTALDLHISQEKQRAIDKFMTGGKL